MGKTSVWQFSNLYAPQFLSLFDSKLELQQIKFLDVSLYKLMIFKQIVICVLLF